jgi:hypothetical protein
LGRLNETIEVVTLNASGEVVDIGVANRVELRRADGPPIPRDPKMLNVVLDGMYKQIDKIVGADDLGRKLNELKNILPEIAADLSGHDQRGIAAVASALTRLAQRANECASALDTFKVSPSKTSLKAITEMKMEKSE